MILTESHLTVQETGCIWGGKVNFGYDGGVKYLGSTYLVLDGEAFCIDEQIGKGSVGFLELINPTISGLFNCGYAYDQYTVIGAADDATSLENMRQALYGILECNELRKGSWSSGTKNIK